MIFLTDAAGQCVYASSEWAKLTGQEIKDALGRGSLARVHPDDRSTVEDIINQATQQGAEFNVRYRLLKPDDTCRWVAAGGVPSFGLLGDAFAGYLGTITELAEGATDTIRAYGKVERFRPPAPYQTTTPNSALDRVADHLIMAHSLIEDDGGKRALPDLRNALFKIGQALAEKVTERERLN
ncbi:PAS domain-containing protein [Methylobacterium sp. WL103]|uniref:PAS domain-containing protein n=1 Tax=Methylobacterium sp. WL103 TaxID=2603891 RepID=UPI0011C91239|nr:PAS domain-containing protein [Methylobacterium sp. WL103]TXM94383.1 PAS domain-containing protein [Methylobacterium sp. WL103]